MTLDAALAIAPLHPGEVRVYYAWSERAPPPGQVRDLLAMLSRAERARHGRLYFEHARKSYLVAHALTRAVLGRLLGVAPEALRFESGPRGRPELAPHGSRPRLRFNLSHTRGLSACAVALETDVGVDVEHAGRAVAIEQLAARVCSVNEQVGLHAVPPRDMRRRFFELWTLKEAYLKAVGHGLTLPPRAVGLELEPAPPRLQLGAPIDDDSGRWFLHLQAVGNAHLLALAFGHPSPSRVVLRELSLKELGVAANTASCRAR